MRWLKLRWYRWLLRKHYDNYKMMLDCADCGSELLKTISLEFAQESEKVENLYDKCQELEAVK
jgi:hypothetical protein